MRMKDFFEDVKELLIETLGREPTIQEIEETANEIMNKMGV